jgi:hypothetical protein
MVEASFQEKRDSLSRNLWRKLIVYKQMIMFCLQDFAFIKCLLCNINKTLFVFNTRISVFLT